MNRECSIIINRFSGNYSERRVRDVVSLLESRGFSPRLTVVGNIDEATICARRECTYEPDPFLVVAGGDGTVNGVINGVTPGIATLAVIPFGTSNVLARELNIGSIEEGLAKIARGETRPACVGLLEKEGFRRYFILMAGIGFDGFTVEGVSFRRKRFLGKGAYLLSALHHLVKIDKELMRVSTNDGSFECNSLIVCNSAKYAGNFMLAPECSLFEPNLTALYVKRGRRGTYIRTAVKLLMQLDLRSADVCLLKSAELTVNGTKPVQVDGDYLCRGPVKIRAVPDFVRLIV